MAGFRFRLRLVLVAFLGIVLVLVATLALSLTLGREWKIEPTVGKFDNMSGEQQIVEIGGERRLLISLFRRFEMLTEQFFAEVMPGAPRHRLDGIEDGENVVFRRLP